MRTSGLMYVNPETDALIDVDVQPTFTPEHFAMCGARLPAGGLAVRDGHQIVPVIKNRVHKVFPKERRYATCDRHKKGSVSFASSFVGQTPNTALTLEEVRLWTDGSHRIASHALFSLTDLRAYLEALEEQTRVRDGKSGGGIQITWSDHGLAGTPEGALHPDLHDGHYAYVQYKGEDPCCDSYSGLLDNLGRPVGLGERLQADGVERVFITGLASDFCVKWTAVNAVREYGFAEVFVILDATRPVDIPGNESVAGSMTKAMYEMVAAGITFVHSDQLRLVINPR